MFRTRQQEQSVRDDLYRICHRHPLHSSVEERRSETVSRAFRLRLLLMTHSHNLQAAGKKRNNNHETMNIEQEGQRQTV